MGIDKEFEQPKDVTRIDMAFGGDVSELMPKYSEIPVGYNGEREWKSWQSDWFFKGLERMPKPKPGIDADKAISHLRAIQVSFDPKHEHKEAGVAWLASKWFEMP